MEFVKRHDTADTTDFCPRQLFTDLRLQGSRQIVTDLLRRNWCNGFLPYCS